MSALSMVPATLLAIAAFYVTSSAAIFACLLTAHLLEIQQKSAAPLLLVAQYDPVVWKTEAFASEQRRATKAVLDCARQRGLKVLDTFDALAASNVPGGPRGLYGQWHMNDAGNEAVAGLIAAALDPPAH